MIPDVRIQQVAPYTIELQFERRIDPAVHNRVMRCAEALSDSAIRGIDSVFITYHSVGIHLRESAPSDFLRSLTLWVEDWRRQDGIASRSESLSQTLHRIPVRFGGTEGPDLSELARFAHMTEEDVVRMFCEPEYRVYMTGFIGGFPYLGMVPEPLRIPRKAQPRKRVAAGSVGIASFQAGIYPVETPGGWTLIGRTDLALSSLDLKPGDSIRFTEARRD
jgi:inhibitor of KinA